MLGAVAIASFLALFDSQRVCTYHFVGVFTTANEIYQTIDATSLARNKSRRGRSIRVLLSGSYRIEGTNYR